MLVDSGTANIVDVCFDGIKDPVMLLVNAVEFANKYNLFVGSTIILSEQEQYEDRNILLVSIKSEHYLVRLNGGKVIDISDDKVYDISKVTIIARAYGRWLYYADSPTNCNFITLFKILKFFIWIIIPQFFSRSFVNFILYFFQF